MFPMTRMRRLRRNETMRRMVRETTLTPADLQGAAQKYIKLDKLVKVKAGDLSKSPTAKAS